MDVATKRAKYRELREKALKITDVAAGGIVIAAAGLGWAYTLDVVTFWPWWQRSPGCTRSRRRPVKPSSRSCARCEAACGSSSIAAS